jgi:hypothetical protein
MNGGKREKADLEGVSCGTGHVGFVVMRKRQARIAPCTCDEGSLSIKDLETAEAASSGRRTDQNLGHKGKGEYDHQQRAHLRHHVCQVRPLVGPNARGTRYAW